MSTTSSISDIRVAEKESVHYDETKFDEVNFAAQNHEVLSQQFAELESEGQQAIAERTWYSRALNMEIKLNFRKESHMILMLGIFASFAGILSGLDQSIISGAQIGMRKSLSISDHEMALVSSLMPLGAMAGSMLMVPFNHFIGRRGSIIVSCLWYTLGAGLCAGSHNIPMMYAGRFLLGVGVGIEGGCVGIYISESVPARVRGSLVSMYQFNIALGEVLGYACSAIFFEVHGGWRFMVGSSLVFSTILLVGMFFLPESPRWLVSKNKVGEAWLVWKRLRNVNDAAAQVEFLEMRQVIRREQEEQRSESATTRWLELFNHARSRRALVYAVIMVFLGQMTGVNGVMYNMSTLMHAIGFDDRKSVLMSLVGGGSLLIGTIPGILFMDKMGRRVWAQNIVGFFIGLIFLGIGFLIPSDTNRPASLGVYFTGVVLYMGFFGSYACLTWVLPAESFDLRTRSQGMAICSVTLYLFSFIVTYNFQRMVDAMTYTGLMIGFFGGIALIGFVYQLLFMPETKDKTLEEIDDIFSMPTHKLVQANMSRVRHRISSFGLRGKT